MSVSDQTQLLLARYGLIVAIGLALLGPAALGSAAMTYMDPPVEQVTEQTNQQFVSTNVETSAVVTNGTALYDEGEILTDMPVYFFSASPNLTLRVRTNVPSDHEVDVSKRVVLELRGVRDGREFYQERRVITARSAQVTDGVAWTNATMNMSAIRTDVTEKRAAIGGVGSLSVTLRLNTSYETNQYTGTLTSSSSLVFAEQAFWLGGDMEASRTHTTPVTRQVTGSPDMVAVGGLSLLGVGLLVMAVVVALRYRKIDPAAIETELSRSRFDEWISGGEIPTKSEKEYVRTDSLEDLVDVAIDSNGRVIYDRNIDAYAVVEGDIVYYFTTDESEFSDWFEV